MTKNIKKIFRYYKIFRTPGMYNSDLKLFRKFNVLIQKYKNTNKEIYLKEANNTIIIVNNIFEISNDFINIITDEYIEQENKQIFQNMIKSLQL